MTVKEKQDRSTALHDAGYNCSQSVYLAVGELSEKEGGIGYCFGGGMQCGSVCGALTGGLMAIGASLQETDPMKNRPVARKAALELEAAFEKEFGSINCREVSVGGKKICAYCITFCVEKTTEIIEKINKGEL